MNPDDDTRLRWPDDPGVIRALQDVLHRMGPDRVICDLIPGLSGRAAVACYLMAHGHDIRDVRARLHIGADAIRGIAGAIVEAMADQGETVILPADRGR